MNTEIAYSKNIPIIGHYDVVVLGGGPSGVCAAIEAARNGLQVLLVESSGMLGGMATTALVGPFMTNYDRDGNRPVVGGLFDEIVERLVARQGAYPPATIDAPSIYTSFITNYHRHVTPINSFLLQIVLDEMVKEAGVEVLLYTRFADCVCESGKIQSVVLNMLEGLRAVTADVYVDCTGNADVAAHAGVPYWKGEEESGIPQPATLMFEVCNVNDEAYGKYAARPEYPVKAYRTPTENCYKVNHYRVFETDATSSASMTKSHMEARLQVLDAFNVLHDKTPGFENAIMTQVAPFLGVRESRHIEGKYKLTVDDISKGVKFDDRVAAYGYGMDVHPRNASGSGNFKIPTAEIYYIPYRAMLPVNCENLIVAGRTICCESQAAGAMRVMPCAMALGQAAGVATMLSIRNKVTPESISVSELQTILKDHGAILD